MFSRAVRPLMRSQPLAASIRTATFTSRVARPSVSALVSQARSRPATEPKKAAPIATQSKTRSNVPSTTVLMAAMPQMVPFYFVNEVVLGYAAILTLIYLMTKYWLPQTVRARLARLFVSKL